MTNLIRPVGNTNRQTSEHTRGGIKCLRGVLIPCRPVTPALSPTCISRSGERYEPLARSVYQERLNDWHETRLIAFGLMESCIGKLYVHV
jgi:hypothetical protein